MALREQLTDEIEAADFDNWNVEIATRGDALYLADRILAIPHIAAALKLLDEQERLMLGGSVGRGG